MAAGSSLCDKRDLAGETPASQGSNHIRYFGSHLRDEVCLRSRALRRPGRLRWWRGQNSVRRRQLGPRHRQFQRRALHGEHELQSTRCHAEPDHPHRL